MPLTLSLCSSVIARATIHTSYVPSNNRTSESVLLTCCCDDVCRSFHTCLRSLCLPVLFLLHMYKDLHLSLTIIISMQYYISQESFNRFPFFCFVCLVFLPRSLLIFNACGSTTMLVNWCSVLAGICCFSHSLTMLLLNQIPGLCSPCFDGETEKTKCIWPFSIFSLSHPCSHSF